MQTLSNDNRTLLLLAATAVLLAACLSARAEGGGGHAAAPSLANAVRDSGENRAGFKVERYSLLWERNPFTLPSQTASETRRSPFDNLFLTCWLIDGGKEVICVENSETKEVQTIATEPNQNNIRLINLRHSADPRLVEAVISDSNELGTVKFRSDAPTESPSIPPQNPAMADSQAALVPNKTSDPRHASPVNPGTPYRIYPGMPRVYHEGGGLGQSTAAAASRRKHTLQASSPAQ